MDKRPLVTRIGEGLAEIRILLEDPHGAKADQVLDGIVARYNEKAFEFIACANLILHPRWPAWHRLLQVRFLQLICNDRPAIKATVAAALEQEPRPTSDRLLREAFRWCLIEKLEWGKKYKGTAKARQSPKGMEYYWQHAFDSLNDDMADQIRHGKTFDEAPSAWYSILDIDYSIASVPN